MQVGLSTVHAYAGTGSPATMTVSVAPGTYQVSTDAGRSTIQASADVAIDAAGSEPAPVGLSGRVAMADGLPLPGNLTLHLVPDLSGDGGPAPAFLRTGGLIGVGRGGQFGSRPIELPIAADGSFTGKGVVPGSYQIRATSGATRMLIAGAAASGAQLATDGRLQLGTESAMLAVTVAPATGTATGLVVGADGQPESGAMVLLIPQPGPGTSPTPSAALYGEEESDSDGTWTVRDLAPGNYLAVAIRDGWDLAWRKPAVMARYLSTGAAVPVTISPTGVSALPSALPVQTR